MSIEKAIAKMGQEPLNPIGHCFNSAAHQFIFGENYDNTVMCHGLGISNMPGEEGNIVGHAWLEATTMEGIRVVLDTTWGVIVRAEDFRNSFKPKKVVNYTRDEFLDLWKKYDFPGPFDKEICEVVDKGSKIKLAGML